MSGDIPKSELAFPIEVCEQKLISCYFCKSKLFLVELGFGKYNGLYLENRLKAERGD